jgi:hypothetical protein
MAQCDVDGNTAEQRLPAIAGTEFKAEAVDGM